MQVLVILAVIMALAAVGFVIWRSPAKDSNSTSVVPEKAKEEDEEGEEEPSVEEEEPLSDEEIEETFEGEDLEDPPAEGELLAAVVAPAVNEDVEEDPAPQPTLCPKLTPSDSGSHTTPVVIPTVDVETGEVEDKVVEVEPVTTPEAYAETVDAPVEDEPEEAEECDDNEDNDEDDCDE